MASTTPKVMIIRSAQHVAELVRSVFIRFQETTPPINLISRMACTVELGYQRERVSTSFNGKLPQA